MRRIFFLATFFLTFALAMNTLGAAYANCEMLAGKTLRDRQLWVNVGGEWRDFNDVHEFPTRGLRRIPFVYVIQRSEGDTSNTGAIVIKSGLKNVPGGTRGPDNVRLIRDRASASAYCEMAGNREVFSRASVSKKAYDQYHDRDYGDENTVGGKEFGETIRDFHVGLKRNGACVRTNSSTDSSGQWIPRNMRSQFSFDTNIVDYGMSAHYVTAGRIILGAVFTSVLAGGSDGFNSQRTEIKSYRIKDGVSCTSFFAAASSHDFIIRINDLGARLAGSTQTETRWEH
jgi:hypothetical protein